ncbi:MULTISPECIES: DUF167 domain-containing protein [unclassified Flavobacterium]|jgi:uncharacterized protein (TIGR00251 family)|uniref:DUF167 domain-containing protein n=1 Tax=unclassified Flavobacterium TaxID=196869 RepID=UPI0025B9D93F|nr:MULTISPECIES: DUF167 domain-containing protein [unclassified Flavobacterium]
MARKKKTQEIILETTQEPEINPKKMNSFYAWDGGILVLNILGTPSAKRDAIGKVKGNQLKVSVTESPRAGKATDHMVRFLAKEFQVSNKDIEVVFGRFNVNKQLRIKNIINLPSEISREIER